ncbi:hypothetical protein Poly51_00050 [Rubripirellula tenax]|uniref:Uncharacterized protein n=1 Tax=Rubripirellula tenax TaxID=2528015 RepID=A0A5C6FGP2_9BACT|nr:hypothetical protein Poly51_00050 [Rubripirellula tenax]
MFSQMESRLSVPGDGGRSSDLFPDIRNMVVRMFIRVHGHAVFVDHDFVRPARNTRKFIETFDAKRFRCPNCVPSGSQRLPYRKIIDRTPI